MFYTGVGSRNTPIDIQDLFTRIGKRLEERGYILRSGGANGADLAFEKEVSPENKQIFLPWKGFNNNPSLLYDVNPEHIKYIVHPYIHKLKYSVKMLMVRNQYQVLGPNRKGPKSKFLICWTPEGALVGGTAEAIQIANSVSIPVINFGNGTKEENITKLTKLV